MVRLYAKVAERHPVNPDSAWRYCAPMTNETVETDESQQECAACVGGWGHQVDMTDGFECKVRCYQCREPLVIHAQDEEWCCDHRYVGEDLWRAEEYYNNWGCPLCGGGYGEHDSTCEFSPCPFCGAVGDCATNCDSYDETSDDEDDVSTD